MLEQSYLINLSAPKTSENTTSRLRLEYQASQYLFRAQPALVQQYLGAQAAVLAEEVMKGARHVRFSLPDQVMVPGQETGMHTVSVPVNLRQQVVGSPIDWLVKTDICNILGSHLTDLEHSENLAVSTSGILMRYRIATHMAYNMLPSGKSVVYQELDGEDVPSVPVRDGSMAVSALMEATNPTQVEASGVKAGQGELTVPYAESARQFYLPQWVAFDDKGHLLVNSIEEAEADIVSMQCYLSILLAAVRIAPYMVADEEYQRKHYGMLGQLVNQGRALAWYEMNEMVNTIKRRAAIHDLDRGLELILPYFNDETYEIENYHIDVIPMGRVMFVPAFVVLAVRAQGAKIAQDTRLNKSTRKHLLMELSVLERTFLR